jgi:hypothetical protein
MSKLEKSGKLCISGQVKESPDQDGQVQSRPHEYPKYYILPFSFFSRIPGYSVGCYYCLFQQGKLLPETVAVGSEHNPSEYVVCFLGGSEKGLELYPFIVV